MAKKKTSGSARSVPDTGPAVFAVNLSTLRLPEDVKARVGEQLTQAVLDELARTDKGTVRAGSSTVVVGQLRKDWYGGIYLKAIRADLRQRLLSEIEGALDNNPAGVVPDTSPAISAVDLSNLKLPSDAKARLGAQLSRTVLDELAKTDRGAARGARSAVGEPRVAIMGQLRKDWYGGIRLDTLKPDLQQQLTTEIQNTLEKLGPR